MAPHYILFFVVFLSLFIGMHYYVLYRVVFGLGLMGTTAVAVRLLFAAGALAFLGGELLTHRYASLAYKPLYLFGMIWMGTLAIGVTVFLLADAARLFVRTAPARQHLVAGAVALTLGLAILSIVRAGMEPRIRELTLTLPGGRAIAPCTIVQLTDLHLNLMTSARWFERIVTATNAQRPDIIVITGDLLDGDLTRRDDLIALLGRLYAPGGVYAISGNHEVYTGMQIFRTVAHMAGIGLLDNRSIVMDCGIQLIGVGEQPTDPPYLSIVNVSTAAPAVLLRHQPIGFDEARARGIDLQLSGHTHAGQIPPMDAIVRLVFKHPYGLFAAGGAYIYTSPGTGWWGPPMRLFSRCEITKIVLKNK